MYSFLITSLYKTSFGVNMVVRTYRDAINDYIDQIVGFRKHNNISKIIRILLENNNFGSNSHRNIGNVSVNVFIGLLVNTL